MSDSNGKVPDLDTFLKARRSGPAKPSFQNSPVQKNLDNDIENKPDQKSDMSKDLGGEQHFKKKIFLAKRRKFMSPALRLQTLIKDEDKD